MTSANERRRRIKGRQAIGPFLMLPHNVLNHPAFVSLNSRAVKLLLDIAVQYNGRNNGDLCAPLSLMSLRGWNSSDQLHKAKKELVRNELIMVSRQGGINKTTLFAVTWVPVDECNGKLDIAATKTAPVKWNDRSLGPPRGSKAS
mgnify:FL=1